MELQLPSTYSMQSVVRKAVEYVGPRGLIRSGGTANESTSNFNANQRNGHRRRCKNAKGDDRQSVVFCSF